MSTPRTIPLATYEAGMLQAAANRNLTTFLTNALKSSNITISEWSALGILATAGDARPSDIATTMDVKTPMATRLIQSLLEKNLVAERKVSEDQRGKLIVLTKEGKKLLDEEELVVREGMREYMKDVDRDDLVAYLKVVEYLARHQPKI
ncbi:MAG: MarR family transcriptional regulator [Candidatus Saccharibacteria bacterium]